MTDPGTRNHVACFTSPSAFTMAFVGASTDTMDTALIAYCLRAVVAGTPTIFTFSTIIPNEVWFALALVRTNTGSVCRAVVYVFAAGHSAISAAPARFTHTFIGSGALTVYATLRTKGLAAVCGTPSLLTGVTRSSNVMRVALASFW